MLAGAGSHGLLRALSKSESPLSGLELEAPGRSRRRPGHLSLSETVTRRLGLGADPDIDRTLSGLAPWPGASAGPLGRFVLGALSCHRVARRGCQMGIGPRSPNLSAQPEGITQGPAKSTP
jgi:hypothetical protein